ETDRAQPPGRVLEVFDGAVDVVIGRLVAVGRDRRRRGRLCLRGRLAGIAGLGVGRGLLRRRDDRRVRATVRQGARDAAGLLARRLPGAVVDRLVGAEDVALPVFDEALLGLGKVDVGIGGDAEIAAP